jgi:hypothetical protein
MPPEISIDEQLRECEREIEMRYNVYDRRVAAGKMSAVSAGRKIATMKAVINSLTEYRRLLEAQL